MTQAETEAVATYLAARFPRGIKVCPTRTARGALRWYRTLRQARLVYAGQ